jgi:hypothetical protein
MHCQIVGLVKICLSLLLLFLPNRFGTICVCAFMWACATNPIRHASAVFQDVSSFIDMCIEDRNVEGRRKMVQCDIVGLFLEPAGLTGNGICFTSTGIRSNGYR